MIGVFGGTFDPIHFGHLRTALEIREALELKQIRLIPCAQPPHRSQPLVSAKIRMEMLEAATQSEPYFKVDGRELKRSKPSYTVDTLESLRADMPRQRFALIVGGDSFMGLTTWYHWQSLFDLAHIVVMERPGVCTEFQEPLRHIVAERRIDNAEGLTKSGQGRIFFHRATQLNISASAIRILIREGNNPRYLIPDSVCEMIKKYNLYRDDENDK